MDTFIWIWKYLRQYKLILFTAFFLAFVATLLGMVSPFIQGRLVDQVIIGREFSLLLPLCGIMVGAILGRSLLRYIYLLCFESVSQKSIFKIREEIYKTVQDLDFVFFDRTKTGDIMARMTGDLEAVRHFSSWVVFATFSNLVMFIAVIVVILTINFKFALILLSITPITGFLTYRLASSVKPAFSAIREQFSKLNSVTQENISGNRVVKAFAKEGHEISKFGEENKAFKQRNIDAAEVWGKYLPILDSTSGILSIIVILIGGIMVINKSLTLGELVTFNAYIWALNQPMRMAGWIVNDIQRFAASAEKIMTLLKTDTSIKNNACPVTKDKINGEVEFKNVSFSYGEKQILHNISFKAKPGETIAIIGPTGSFKSTLVSLISRFYDCTKGEILIDGVNIKDMEMRLLRSSIGMAMQDIFLFSDTIEGNIAYGVPQAQIDQVKMAAKVAGAHEFIKSFPEGYDTIIGERGVGLSGGQKQRIALARAILKNPPIMILDDTTSSVDIETEHKIHTKLKAFYEGKTTFVIAHRISSVKNADIILVLDDGEIVERGTHDELLKMKGHYYSVFENQYGDFENIREKLEVV